MKPLFFLLRRPGNRVLAPVVDALAQTAGMAFALIILRGIQAAMLRRKFALEHPLILPPLGHSPIMRFVVV